MLERNDIMRGLSRLAGLAREAGCCVEIAIYGGSAIALVWAFRAATQDVDAVISRSEDSAFVRDAVAKIATENGWNQDWLNDGVRGFLSANESLNEYDLGAQPGENPGLRVFVPTPEYMLAMKCMAMRLDAASHDVADIRALITITHAQSVDQVLAIVERYYPRRLIPPKVELGVREIFKSTQTEQSNGTHS